MKPAPDQVTYACIRQILRRYFNEPETRFSATHPTHPAIHPSIYLATRLFLAGTEIYSPQCQWIQIEGGHSYRVLCTVGGGNKEFWAALDTSTYIWEYL